MMLSSDPGTTPDDTSMVPFVARPRTPLPRLGRPTRVVSVAGRLGVGAFLAEDRLGFVGEAALPALLLRAA